MLSQVVAKISDQPFLFAIAIVALIIGVIVFGANLGSAEIRLIIGVIAVITLVAIGGYYICEGQKMVNEQHKQQEVPSPPISSTPPQRKQEMMAEEGAQIDGALQEGTEVGSQVISAKGPNTSIKNAIQSSSSESRNDKETSK